MTTLLDAYEADTVADINEVLAGMETEIPDYVIDHDRIAAAAADKRAQVARILADGLDIGTVIKHVIPVTLDKHAEYGWVFVSQARRRHGEMFYAYNYVK